MRGSGEGGGAKVRWGKEENTSKEDSGEESKKEWAREMRKGGKS